MPSRPPLQSEIAPSTSGIIRDPHTGGRVVASSRRPDGTFRKEIRIRPGYTPQEDVTKFRTARQQDSDRRALPKGSVVGYVRPEEAAAKAALAGMSAAQRKNQKRKEKRKAGEHGHDTTPEDWDADAPAPTSTSTETLVTPPEPLPPGGVRKVVGSSDDTTPESRSHSAIKSSDPASPSLAYDTEKATISPGGISSELANVPPGASSNDRSARGSATLFDNALSDIGAHTDKQKRARGLKKKLAQAEELEKRLAAGETLLPEQADKVDQIANLRQQLDSLSV